MALLWVFLNANHKQSLFFRRIVKKNIFFEKMICFCWTPLSINGSRPVLYKLIGCILCIIYLHSDFYLYGTRGRPLLYDINYPFSKKSIEGVE